MRDTNGWPVATGSTGTAARPSRGSFTPSFTPRYTGVYYIEVSAPGRVSEGLAGHSVSFTTGGNPGGYRLSEVRLKIGVVSGSTPRVSIYSDSSGVPGNSLKVLDNPANIPSFSRDRYDSDEVVLGEQGFGAANFRLEQNTRYWVVIERASGSGGVLFDRTGSHAEDSSTAPGWSIGDGGFERESNQSWSNADSVDTPIRFSIIGEPIVAPAGDAMLRGLALRDPHDNIIPLDPPFAAMITSYTATVANSISRIKVEPNGTDNYATITYMDNADIELSDADPNTGVFDLNLDVGENVVKVKVTARGGTTSTYVVTVTRLDALALVSNLGQAVDSHDDIGLPEFSTGAYSITVSEVVQD